MQVIGIYIVWVKTWWSRYAKIAKQNVSWVFHRKALLANYSRKPAVMTLCIPIMCSACGSLCRIASHESSLEIHLVFNENLSLHTLTHTTLTMKSHIKYRVNMIEQNYNKIWHEIKTNTKQLYIKTLQKLLMVVPLMPYGGLLIR